MRKTVALGLALMGVATIAVTPQRKDTVGAATEFLASLDRTQHRSAIKTVHDDYRTRWKFTPTQREGVSWKNMTNEQEQKAMVLLKSVLSDTGILKTGQVRQLEQHLAELSGNTTFRDHEAYYFTFFGTPSKTEEWAWRYEGHHVSLNFSYKGEQLIASTPQFFGSNPAEVRTGEKKGLRMLAKEQDMAFELLHALTDEQKSTAVVSSRAPSDIFTGENKTALRQKDEGIRFKDMTKSQQQLLLNLIRLHAESQQAKEVKRRLDVIEQRGQENITFVWMGSASAGRGHYYRVQGPSFLIEYDNTQNNSNHIHAVWRDFEGDFGRDLLSDHYKNSDHHKRD